MSDKSDTPRRRLDQIRDHYLPRLHDGLANYDVLDWASPEAQLLRFDILIDNVELENKTLLDVGCGLGDLATHLAQKSIHAHYTGVDILPELLLRAQTDHPACQFSALNLFDENASPHDLLAKLGQPAGYDVIFCSGTLNLNLGNSETFLPHALQAMLAMTHKNGLLVFNLLDARDPACPEDPRYAARHPRDVLALLEPLAHNIHLIDHYLKNDFTITCQTQL